jgi:hypothetical protein
MTLMSFFSSPATGNAPLAHVQRAPLQQTPLAPPPKETFTSPFPVLKTASECSPSANSISGGVKRQRAAIQDSDSENEEPIVGLGMRFICLYTLSNQSLKIKLIGLLESRERCALMKMTKTTMWIHRNKVCFLSFLALICHLIITPMYNNNQSSSGKQFSNLESLLGSIPRIAKLCENGLVRL